MGYKLKNKRNDHDHGSSDFNLEIMLKQTKDFFDEKKTQKIFDDVKEYEIDKPIDSNFKGLIWYQNCLTHFEKRLKVDGYFDKSDIVLELYILLKFVVADGQMSREDSFKAASHIYGHLQEGIDQHIERSKAGERENSRDIMMLIVREVFEHIAVVDANELM